MEKMNRKVRNDAPAGNSSKQGGATRTRGLANRPAAPPGHFRGGGPAHGGPGPMRQHPKVLMPIR